MAPMSMNRRLLLSGILLTYDSVSIVTVQAKQLWIPSSLSDHLSFHNPSVSASVATGWKANSDDEVEPLFLTNHRDRNFRLGYKMNGYVSIVDSLRVRGGSTDDANDGEADNGSKRRRRRRRKKAVEGETNESNNNEAVTGDIPSLDSTATEDHIEEIIRSDEDGVVPNKTKKKVRKRRKQLSRMFRINNNIDSKNESGEDGDADAETMGGGTPKMVEDLVCQLDDVEEKEADDKTTGATSINGGVSRTKKRKRRRRVVATQEENPADSTEDEGEDSGDGVAAVDSVSETQDESKLGDTPVSRIKKKREKRRATATGDALIDEDKSKVEASVDEGSIPVEPIDSSPGDPIDSPPAIHGELLAEDSEPQVDEKVKKVRRRRKRKVDTLSSGGDEVLETPSTLEDADESTSTADQSISISIDDSIEIPDEEIVPKSIDATIAIEENIMQVDPTKETLDESAAASNLAEEAESLPGTTKKGRKRRKRRETDALSLEEESGELSETNFESLASIVVDSSIEIPSEEIVPESIGASVEVGDSVMPVEMKDECGAVESPTLAVHIADDREELEGPSPEIDDAEDHKEANEDAPSSIETPTAPVIDEEQSTLVEEEMIESIDEEESGETETHLSIDASIEVPSEEIVPESIGVTVEIDENGVDGMEVDPLEADAAEIILTFSKDEGVATTAADTVADISEDSEEDEIPNLPVVDVEQATVEEDGMMDDDEEEHCEVESNDEEESGVMETRLSIDASIEVPSEEIVPESIGARVGIEENGEEPMYVNSLQSDVVGFPETDPNEEVVSDSSAAAWADDILEDLKGSEIGKEAQEEKDEEIAGDGDSGAVGGAAPMDDEMEEGKDFEGDPVVEDDADEARDEEKGLVEEDEGESEVDASVPTDDSPGASAAASLPSIPTEEESAEEALESIQSDTNDEPSHSKQDDEIIVKEEIDQPSTSKHDRDVTKKEERNETIDEQETEKLDDNCLTLSVVTWNLAEKAPSEKEASFFGRFRKKSNGVGSDLVLIGAQECEEIKPRRSEGHRSRHIRRMGIMMLGKEYVPLAIHSLGGIQCALYCHRDVLGDVETIDIADVTCGVGNVFHNKGAIGVYLKMKHRGQDEKEKTKSSRMLFVTGHLAAHLKNVDARNNDFKRIIGELEAQAPARFLRPRRNRDGSPAECDGSHLLRSMDHVFFAGDLNYRIDLPREYVERCILDIKQCTNNVEAVAALMNKLLRRDQLLQTISSGRAFADFNEGQIAFLPTFKFDKGTSDYDTSHKQRVPAWTDRILFKSDKVRVLEYQSVPEAKHSDHRPVFGTFRLGWGIVEKTKLKGFARKPKRSRSRQKKN